MDYNQALIEIVTRRRDDEYAANIFRKEMIRLNPEFRKAELALRSAELDFAFGRIGEDALSILQHKRDAVVERLGIKDKLDPPVHCRLCNDTGRVDGKLCSCVRKLALSTRTDNVDLPVRSFDEADYSIFGEAAAARVAKTAAEMRTIADKGENAKRKNINLLGRPGTGKTYLAGCMAGAFLDRAKSVVFITAFGFVDRALKYHTTFDSGKADILTPLLDADLLIIDDLGTESILKNVTLEYLYHVINERQLHGLTTVITSNLSVEAIAKRYGERIASRIFDERICLTREFDFEDVRREMWKQLKK